MLRARPSLFRLAVALESLEAAPRWHTFWSDDSSARALATAAPAPTAWRAAASTRKAALRAARRARPSSASKYQPSLGLELREANYRWTLLPKPWDFVPTPGVEFDADPRHWILDALFALAQTAWASICP